MQVVKNLLGLPVPSFMYENTQKILQKRVFLFFPRSFPYKFRAYSVIPLNIKAVA